MKISVNQRVDTRLLIVMSIFIVVLLGLMNGRQHYQSQLMFEQFYPQEQELNNYIDQVILRNPEFFENPLEQINRDQVQAVGTSIQKAPRVESQVLSLFSIGQQWIYNTSLTSVMDSGKMVVMTLGIVIGALTYGQSGRKTISKLLQCQGVIFASSILACWIYFVYYHHTAIAEQPLYLLISQASDLYSVWAPSLFYYIIATLAGFLFWTAHSLLGVLVGVLGRNLVLLLMAQTFLSQVLFRLLIFYPISPIHFAHRSIGRFLLMSISDLGGYSHTSFILFLISMAITYFAIVLILKRHLSLEKSTAPEE